MLESEWVLRSVYDFSPDEIAQTLQGLVRLPNVRCENPPAALSAIEALSAGMDFADAMHLAAGRQADEGFASFDLRFVKRVRRLWPEVVIRTP